MLDSGASCASLVPSRISPRANMPGRALPGCGMSTYTRPVRVLLSIGRRDGAHLAVELRAVGRGQFHVLADADLAHARFGHFRAPFDATLAQQAQHLAAGLRDLADD